MWVGFMAMLPRALRRSILFSRMHIDESSLANVRVKLVETSEEALGAASLLHDAYVQRGILVPHATQLHLNQNSAAPETWSFVATSAGRVVGTVSLAEDPGGGLPIEKVFGTELAAIRGTGERVAEIGALAIAPEFRHSGLVYWLNRIMIRTAMTLGIDRVVIAVHPKAESIYRDTCLFRRVGEERSYPGLNESARAIAMALPLATLEQDFLEAFGSLGPRPCNAHWLYFTSEIPQIEQPVSLDPHSADRRRVRKAIARARPDLITPRRSLLSFTGELTLSDERTA